MQLFPTRRARRAAILAAVFGAVLTPTLTAPPARAAAITPAMGAAGPLQPPAAALAPNGVSGDGTRGLGLTQPAGPAIAPAASLSAADVTATTSLPASDDISQYNPPVADQGPLSSCASWVTAYYMRGWYARRDGYYPAGGANGAGSFAPMYLFNQITGGHDTGTTFNANLDMMTAQGVDTRADYTQGDTDYADAPTTAERTNAGNYKIASYHVLFQGAGPGPAAQQEIEAAIAGGNPVGIGIPIYDNFWNASSTSYYIDGAPGTNHGNHAVFATKYDANGVWIENQWGTWWGLNGWAELSWAFVEQYAWQAITMAPLTPAQPVATPTSTAAPVQPTAINTPVPVAPTNTVAPAPPAPPATNTPIPAPPATNTPAPPVPPTNTAAPIIPTATPVPPTATQAPFTPAQPTATPRPVAHKKATPHKTTAVPSHKSTSEASHHTTVTRRAGPHTAPQHRVTTRHTTMTRRQNARAVAKPEATRTVTKSVAARAVALASRTAALLLMRGPGAPASVRMVNTHGAITVNQSGQRDAAYRSGKARKAPTARLNPWLGPWTAPHGQVLRVAARRHGTAIRLGVRHGRGANATVYREVRVPRAGRVTLRFTYHALTVSRHGLAPARRSWLELDLVNPRTGHTLARLPWTGAARGAAWRSVSVNLSRFHGQRLRLVFRDRQFAPGHTILVDLTAVELSAISR